MNKNIRILWYTVPVMIFCFLLSSDAWAQSRISYQNLVSQQRQQNIYFDFFTLPGNGDSTVQFVSTFRIDHSFLPFKKNNEDRQNEQFYSSVSLSMEVLKAEERVNRRDRVSVEGLESVNRAFWKDTAYAGNYQQTQSNNTFIEGQLQVELKPGLYNYLLQLNRDEYSSEETSRARQVEISPYREQRNGTTIFIESVDNESAPSLLNLLNFGDNVYYGKDFYAFVHLPDFDPQSSYSFNVHRVETSSRDTTKRNQLLEQQLSDKQLIRSVKPTLADRNGDPMLTLDEVTEGGYNYALFKVPNSRFPNAVYKIEVFKDGQKRPVAQSIFRSLWLEMPTSLLNLNIAIDMLRFIENRDTIREINNGSETEREKKFRTYWKSKDPTPETEYNELMAEYYRRIDYAYENFSTINTVGYESDQGQIYIKYGPPQNVERRFPPDEAVVEVWNYGNSQQFIFRATSGFGDFRLVSR